MDSSVIFTLILSIVYYSFWHGLSYLIRGGGFGGTNNYKDVKYFSLPWVLIALGWPEKYKLRSVIAVALFMLPIGNLAFLYLHGYTGWLLASMTLALTVTYALAFTPGWGTYFDIGIDGNYYRNHRERPEVDWILFKIFGPLWIPTNPQVVPDNPDYDLIQSPTGTVNPYEWRRNRDTLGMILRHFYSIVIFGGIAAVKWYFLSISLFQIVAITMLFLPFAIATGYIYRYHRQLKFAGQTGLYRFQDPAGKAEAYTGGVLGLLLSIALVVI